MKIRLYLIICIEICWNALAFGQFGFSMPAGLQEIDIPFEYENNFIVVDIILNKTFPLKMIFDTGAEHTILCQKSVTDLLKINYEKEFEIVGADYKTVLKSYLAKDITIETNSVVARKQNILVLNQDYFRLEECVGLRVQGILGSDLFSQYVVKINYIKHIITLYNPENFEVPRDYTMLPIQINKGKPYITPTLQLENDIKIPATLLIDTGARLSLLLYTNSHPDLIRPKQVLEGNIGYGLGGTITGYAGRVKKLSFSQSIYFDELLADFQDFTLGADSLKVLGRNGIIGNNILNRFTVILDYINYKVYLKPNKNYKQAFEYDKSGLLMIAGGAELNRFYVQHIIKDSPAYEADIHVNDRFLSINRTPTSLMSLQNMGDRFRKKVGKRYRIVILRNGEHLVKYIYLRKLI